MGSHSSAPAAAAPSADASSSQPNALTMLMGMLGQQNQAGGGSTNTMTGQSGMTNILSGGGAGGGASANPFYKPSNRGYTPAMLNPTDANHPVQDLSVGASPPGSVVASNITGGNSAAPSTMSSLSNAIFGRNGGSAMKSATALAGK